MLITVIGNSYATERLSDYFAEDKENIVFTTAKNSIANKIDINPKNVTELKDFIQANEIAFLITADNNLQGIDYGEILNETECCVLALDYNLAKMCSNISSGKKFAYKNKIQTAKFALFEKSIPACEYLQTADLPLVIMPDCVNEKEPPYIAETKSRAEKRIMELFQTGNKKVLIENYTRGFEYTKYLISDSINTFNLFDSISYCDETSSNNISYIKNEIKTKIDNEIIPSILNSIMEEEIEFQGILGITFQISGEEVYFSKFKSFIDSLDIDTFLNTTDENVLDLLYKASCGTMNENYTVLKTNDKYSISSYNNNEIINGCANTISKAIELATFNGAYENLIQEAIREWKR